MTTQTVLALDEPIPHPPEGQRERVHNLMLNSGWRTPAEVMDILYRLYGVRYESASTTARIRDMRKAEFGGYVVTRRQRKARLWEYKVQR